MKDMAESLAWRLLCSCASPNLPAVQLPRLIMENVSIPVPLAAKQASPAASRWIQLAAGMICMMAISSPQYVWTLFTKPMLGQFGGTLSQLQVTFSLLIVLQT